MFDRFLRLSTVRLALAAAGLLLVSFTVQAAETSAGLLPFFFEQNGGQAPDSIHYLARSRGYAVGVESDRVLLRSASSGEELTVRWLDGQSATLEPTEPLATRVSYFVGKDSERWQQGLPTYGRLRYQNVYPGIDLELYGREGQLEYDFVLAPGADPAVIALAFDGAEPVLGEDGGLRLGRFVQSPPVSYQPTAEGNRLVESRYRLEDGQLGFEIGAYDPALPLVIDPVLVYSTHLGYDSDDVGYAITVDLERQAYVTGCAYNAWGGFLTDDPTTPNFSVSGGLEDVFVAKLNAAGTELVYLTFLGGYGNDCGTAIAVTDTGVAYVAGRTDSIELALTGGGFQPETGGDTDAFVARLGAEGLVQVITFLGGFHDDAAGHHGLDVDAEGWVYVAGRTVSKDFPVANAFQLTPYDYEDAFVARLSPDLSTRDWATYFGGSETDCLGIPSCALVVDDQGRPHLFGRTESDDLEPGPVLANGFQTAFANDSDAFLARFESDGSAVTALTYLGGSNHEFYADLAIAGDGTVWVTGETFSEDFPVTADAHQPTYGGGGDAFLARFDLDLGGEEQLLYSSYFGSGGEEESYGIASDELGRVYLVGHLNSGQLALIDPVQDTTDQNDAWIARFETDGTPSFVTYLGGTDHEIGHGIDVDLLGSAYVTGYTRSADYPLQPFGDPIQSQLGGDQDAFAARIDLPVGVPDAPFEYSAKIICGIQPDPADGRLAPGAYSTIVNIHNPNFRQVEFFKKLALAYPPGGQRPGQILPIATDRLEYDQALAADCPDLIERLFPHGLPPAEPDGPPVTYFEGFVVIQSAYPLDVTTVYTTAALGDNGQPSTHSSIDVEQIQERGRTQGADLRLRKSGQVVGSPTARQVLYRLEVANLGPVDATQVVVTDLLMAEIGTLSNFIPGAFSVSHGGAWVPGPLNPDATSLVGTVPLLPAGQIAVLEFAVEAAPEVPSLALRLVDNAHVTSDVADPELENNTTEVVIELP